MTVLEAITQLIDERKEQKRIPHCALLLDVKKLAQLPEEEFRKQVKQLKQEGKIAIKQTINSYSFYLQ